MESVKILQNIFLRYFKVKIFSLLIALFLWLYVVTDNYYTHTVKIPLFLVNKPKGMVLIHPVPEYVEVEIKGTGKDILRFLYSKKRVLIDIHNAMQIKKFSLNVSMVNGIPQNGIIKAVKIVHPKNINVELDNFYEKKVAIKPDIYLRPFDGYIQVGNIVLYPDSVLVSGPQSIVNDIQSVQTDSVGYNKIIKDFSGEVVLEKPKEGALFFSCKKVKYKAKFQRIGERIFSHIPVQIINVPAGVSAVVVPSNMTLKLQGGVEVLSNIDKSMIKAKIDFRSRNRYPQKHLSAVIDLPENIINYEAKPQFFEIIVE